MLMEGIVSLRATFFEMSSLDMAQFLSIPGFSFEFMLRHTQTEIGLVSDPDMFKIFERQMRGGLSFASNRYLRLSKQQRKSESVILADLNNQYGYSLMQRLPIGDYRWEDNCHDTDAVRKRIMALTPDDDRGLVCDVNLRIPPDLMAYLSEFPPAPETKTVCFNDIGHANRVIYKRLHGKNHKFYVTRKLITDYKDKMNYCVYGTTLKLYLELGAELMSCNNIVSFKQEAFCKPYIDMLSSFRRFYSEMKSKLFTSIMKLTANSCFGKFIQALRFLMGK